MTEPHIVLSRWLTVPMFLLHLLSFSDTSSFSLQIIHLKRFQFVSGHWVKSNKIVQFPMEGFDPSAFLAKRQLKRRNSSVSDPNSGVTTVTVKSRTDEDTEEETKEETKEDGGQTNFHGGRVRTCFFLFNVVCSLSKTNFRFPGFWIICLLMHSYCAKCGFYSSSNG